MSLRAFAELVRVQQHSTGELGPLHLNYEQKLVLAALCAYDRVLVLKGRQVGVSTLCCLYDLLFAFANPGVSVVIVADIEDKAKGLLKKCAAWARQLGLPITEDNKLTLGFANGSIIEAKSAISRAPDSDEAKVGRSASYSLVHLSEFAFFANDRSVYASLSASSNLSAQIVIESTATAAQNMFRAFWDNEDKGWHHVFLPIETHADYREDPASISDERWAEMQAQYMFTRRDSAAWWHQRLTVEYLGDVYKMMREYPVIPAHAFAFAEGRWIRSFVRADVVGFRAGLHMLVQGEIEEETLLGVDTAKGNEGDYSAMALVGHKSGKLLGYYLCNTIDVAAYLDVVEAVCAAFKPRAVIIESNGIGQAVYHVAKRWRWNVLEQVSGDKNGEKDIRMRRVGNAIATGQIACPPDLELEVNASVIDKKGLWVGRDDLINAISFALKHREADPASIPRAPELDRRRFFLRTPTKRRASGA